MKRLNNLYAAICSVENLYLADSKARKGKANQKGIMEHDKRQDENILALHIMLRDKTFVTSAYSIFPIYEPKKRMIYRLPYFPDRIVHHAAMNILERLWMSLFTADTYSCIKGKGVHACGRAIKNALKDEVGSRYCLKMDITKFYPSVDHSVLKMIIRKRLKDPGVLWLLDSIIDSAEGLPIGNYLSQYLANLYLTYFDHWIKQTMRVKNYFRYCDDIAIFASSKEELHRLFHAIKNYLNRELKLSIKGNYQIFPIEKRGVDMVGYKFFRRYTRLRKSIKQSFARAIAKRKSRACLAGYGGWAKHGNCLNLLKKFRNEYIKKIQRPGHSRASADP